MITEEIKRFVLTSIDSVPHLEAILLMRQHQEKEWNSKTLAQTLFISEKKTEGILNDLRSGNIISAHDNLFSYRPHSSELKERIDQLADTYAKNLIEVTNLIHSKTNKQAQQFGDAFRWQNERD